MLRTAESRRVTKKLGNYFNAVAAECLSHRFKDPKDKAMHKALRDGWTVDDRDFVHSPDPTTQRIVIKTAMAEASGATGGFLVPPELLLNVDLLLQERSIFYKSAYVQPMTTETMDVPGVDISVGNATGVPSLYGGFQLVPQTEVAAVAEYEPAFAGFTLNAKAYQGYILASNQVVADGGEALGAYLERIIAYTLQWTIEYYALRGSGSNQMMGLINAPGSIGTTRAGGGTISQADLANMAGNLHPACYTRAIWMCNPGALAVIANLAGYFANVGVPGHTGEATALAGHIFQRPLYVTEKLPVKGAGGDVVLFDPWLYCIGDRSLTIEASDQVKFLTFQTAFRTVWRGDGMPLVKKSVTLADGSISASPFVFLHT